MAAFIPNSSCTQPSSFISSPPPSSSYSHLSPLFLCMTRAVRFRSEYEPFQRSSRTNSNCPEISLFRAPAKKEGKNRAQIAPRTSETSTTTASAFQSQKSNGSIIASCAHPFALPLRPALLPDAALWCDGLTIVRNRLHP